MPSTFATADCRRGRRRRRGRRGRGRGRRGRRRGRRGRCRRSSSSKLYLSVSLSDTNNKKIKTIIKS